MSLRPCEPGQITSGIQAECAGLIYAVANTGLKAKMGMRPCEPGQKPSDAHRGVAGLTFYTYAVAKNDVKPTIRLRPHEPGHLQDEAHWVFAGLTYLAVANHIMKPMAALRPPQGRAISGLMPSEGMPDYAVATTGLKPSTSMRPFEPGQRSCEAPRCRAGLTLSNAVASLGVTSRATLRPRARPAAA